MRSLTRTYGFPTFDEFFKVPEFHTMKCDISKKDANYLLEVELPGYSKENISIALERGYLTIEAKQNTNKEEKKENYVYQERSYGTMSRSFYVGEHLKEEDLKAMYKDGILTLQIPEHKEMEEVSK